MLTLNDYRRMVWDLFPYGFAWTRKKGVLDDLVTGIASELENAEGRKEQLLLEMDPRTADEMFTDWERGWGLPDECTPDDVTMARRRAALISKITQLGDMRPTYYLSIAHELGYDAELFEWRPFICGLSVCGDTDMLGNEDVRHAWELNIYGVVQSYFECSIAVCGDPLGSWTEASELECRINRTAPAQSIVFFYYKEART